MRVLAFVLSLMLLVAPAYAGGTGQQIGFGVSDDFFFDIATGNVPGHSLFAKYGDNPDIDTVDGFEVLWDGGGDYAPPTIPRIHDVTSTDADDAGTVVSSGTATGGSLTTLEDTGATFVSDGVAVGDRILNDSNVTISSVSAVTSETVLTAVSQMIDPDTGLPVAANESGDAYRIVTDASTGASVLHMNGLDSSHMPLQEFVVLNGIGTVVTAGTYSHIHRMRVFASASVGAEGVVTATAQTDATVTAQIINGNNQTLMAVFSCPLNKICYIVKWWGTLSKKQAAVSVMNLRGGEVGGMGYILQMRAVDNGGTSSFNYDYAVPVAIPGGADVWVEANTDTNDTGVSSGFDMILVDN